MTTSTSPNNSAIAERPIRVGVFSSLHEADRAVDRLIQAGFAREQISVICSNEAVQRHFEAFHHQDPAGKYTTSAVLAGGAIGAMLGGLAAVAVVATGGIALAAAGGALFGTGGIVGSLVGAMMTRGVEKELANYYDQAVLDGRILVAAEAHDSDSESSLAKAEHILAESGAQPLPLEEG